MKTSNYEADVLIIGGGLAGLTAAVKMKQIREDLKVMVVDKGGIGWAGQTPLTGGMAIYLQPDTVDEFVDFIVEKGNGLSDVKWLTRFANGLEPSTKELFDWGIPYMKNPDGTLYLSQAAYWGVKNKLTSFVPHLATLHLKKMALARGVKLLSKIEVVDLLKDDGGVTGAVGFDILSGDYCVFKSRSTLLANGCCNFKGRVWFTMTCGEGVAAAYRAGAKQRHAEYAHQYDPGDKQSGIWFRGEAASDFIENVQGETFFKKYFPGQLRLGSWALSYAMGAEAVAGRGPLYFNATANFDVFDSNLAKEDIRSWVYQGGGFLNPDRLHHDRGGHDYRSQKSEWTLRFPGRMGSVWVDLDCRSTELQGLWAAGDTVISGCALNGAMSANAYGRWGLPFAYVSALMAAKDIAKVSPNLPKPKSNRDEQERLREKIFAPMTSKSKEFEPWDAILKVQKVVIPIKYNLIREEKRLKEGLQMIEEVRKEMLPRVKAETPHDLLRYHEAESIALCAEMTFRAALYRTESRGSHYREDFPERDDRNWLKWTVIKKDGEKMALSTEQVPPGKSSVKNSGR